jgi:cytochrome c5
VSKQDTHFFNTFSMVIGLLVVVAILILAFARIVAGRTQIPEVFADARYVSSVQERVEPFAREAVVGQDNSALKIEAPASATQITLAVPADGPALYDQVCKNCHGAGLAGAPKAGDKTAWGARIAKGKALLYDHAVKGYQGQAGVMPAKGGRADLSDELIKSGVDFLVSKAQ